MILKIEQMSFPITKVNNSLLYIYCNFNTFNYNLILLLDFEMTPLKLNVKEETTNEIENKTPNVHRSLFTKFQKVREEELSHNNNLELNEDNSLSNESYSKNVRINLNLNIFFRCLLDLDEKENFLRKS